MPGVEGGMQILRALPQESGRGNDSHRANTVGGKADLAKWPRENRIAPLLEEAEVTSHLGKFPFTFFADVISQESLYHRLLLKLCQGMESSSNIKGKNKRD